MLKILFGRGRDALVLGIYAVPDTKFIFNIIVKTIGFLPRKYSCWSDEGEQAGVKKLPIPFGLKLNFEATFTLYSTIV